MKTISEASLENSKAHYCSAFSEELHRYADLDFRAGIEFAQQWISVKDELPLESADEILIKDDESTLVAVYRFGKFNTGFSFEFNPTHWRPIKRE